MLNKVEYFLNILIKLLSDEDYLGILKEGERLKYWKINVRNFLMDVFRKFVGRSIFMVRVEDIEMEKLLVIGLNLKNNDNMEGRVFVLLVNFVNSLNFMFRWMSV